MKDGITLEQLQEALSRSTLHPTLIEGVMCRARNSDFRYVSEYDGYIICDLDHVEQWCEETGRTDEIEPIRQYFAENLHDFDYGIMTEDFIWLYKGKYAQELGMD